MRPIKAQKIGGTLVFSKTGGPLPARRGNKYGAIRTSVDGIDFDSIGEANRYIELRRLEKQGIISHLTLQVPFRIEINRQHVCTYRADFVYHNASGQEIVEDFKGIRTPTYRIKKKLIKAVYGIDILETRA